MNNAVARAAGLIAVAALPAAAGLSGLSYRRPAVFSAGFHTAVLIAAVLAASGGVLAAMTIPSRARPAQRPSGRLEPALAPSVSVPAEYSCPLAAPSLHGSEAVSRLAGARSQEPETRRFAA